LFTVVLPAGSRRVPAWRRPDRARARRSRRELLRELRLRLVAELLALLRRGHRPAHRAAIAGAGPGEASRPRARDPAQARAGGEPARAGMAPRLLHHVAPREEPRPPSLALQLGAAPGRLARQVGRRAARKIFRADLSDLLRVSALASPSVSWPWPYPQGGY